MTVLPSLSTQRTRRAFVLAGVLMGLALPAAAHASGKDVVTDCNTNGRLTKNYSQKDYASALANLPTDVDEYTDCRDIIKQAQLGNAGGSSGSGGGSSSGGGGGASTGGGSGSAGGGGAAPAAAAPKNADAALQGASQDEAAAVAAARAAGAQTPVTTGVGSTRPVDLSKSNITSLGSVPTPLLVALALLALASIAGGGSALINRVRAHRSPA